MPSAFELDREAGRLLDRLIEAYGDAEAIEGGLADWLAAVDDKVPALRAVYYRATSEEARCKAEAAHFTARAKSAAGLAERMKSAATALLLDKEALGEPGKVPGVAFLNISTRVLVPDSVAELPPQFVVVKTEQVPDKTAIKAVLLTGSTVAGCSLETSHSTTFQQRKAAADTEGRE